MRACNKPGFTRSTTRAPRVRHRRLGGRTCRPLRPPCRPDCKESSAPIAAPGGRGAGPDRLCGVTASCLPRSSRPARGSWNWSGIVRRPTSRTILIDGTLCCGTSPSSARRSVSCRTRSRPTTPRSPGAHPSGCVIASCAVTPAAIKSDRQGDRGQHREGVETARNGARTERAMVRADEEREQAACVPVVLRKTLCLLTIRALFVRRRMHRSRWDRQDGR